MRWLVPEMGPSFHFISVSGAAIRFPLISWVFFSRNSWFSVSQKRTSLLKNCGEGRSEGEQGQEEWFYEKSGVT